MFGETLHCGELIKRLNDALGRKANNTLMCNDVTLSQIKVLATISEAADETITLKDLKSILKLNRQRWQELLHVWKKWDDRGVL